LSSTAVIRLNSVFMISYILLLWEDQLLLRSPFIRGLR
jgi:hypothetical protein